MARGAQLRAGGLRVWGQTNAILEKSLKSVGKSTLTNPKKSNICISHNKADIGRMEEDRRLGKRKLEEEEEEGLDAPHEGEASKRPRHEDDVGLGAEEDEAAAAELERQREDEEEERRAVRRAASRFQQTFSEDAEFGRLDYSHIVARGAGAPGTDGGGGDDEAAVEGEEEAKDESSLADEARGGGYRLDGKEVPIEPFHLRNERRQGYYDANGNFVFTRRDNDDEDDEDDVGDEMDFLAKEHRADKQQADAWLRDADTLATTRAIPVREKPPSSEPVRQRNCCPLPETQRSLTILPSRRRS